MQYKPPLVNELFSYRRDSFNTTLRGFPGAEVFATHIRARRNNEEHLETILRDLFSTENPVQYRRVLEIPLYLQELLFQVGRQYVISGGTMFDELVRAIEVSSYDRVLYLTVNYDLFLEDAIKRFYRIPFVGLESYCRDDLKWDLVKLHGSVDWGQLMKIANPGTGPPLAFLDRFQHDKHLDTEICLLKRERTYFGNSGGPYYPTLAIPLGTDKEFACHPSHVLRAQAHIRDCTDFLIIGFSGLDPGVVRLFHNVQQVRKVEVVVGGEESAKDVLGRFTAMNISFRVAIDKPRTSKPLKMKFSEFVTSGEMENFLTAP